MADQPTNEDRAERAREPLATYADQPTVDGDSQEDAIRDLIVDLLHLAALEGYDAKQILATSAIHFDSEEG